MQKLVRGAGAFLKLPVWWLCGIQSLGLGFGVLFCVFKFQGLGRKHANAMALPRKAETSSWHDSVSHVVPAVVQSKRIPVHAQRSTALYLKRSTKKRGIRDKRLANDEVFIVQRVWGLFESGVGCSVYEK